MRILEIGAGCGAYSLRLAEEGFHITAMDPVKRHIEIKMCIRDRYKST